MKSNHIRHLIQSFELGISEDPPEEKQSYVKQVNLRGKFNEKIKPFHLK